MMAYGRRIHKKKSGYIASIDIKTLNDNRILSSVLNSSTNTTISVDLTKLKASPKAFAVVMAANIDGWVKSGTLYKILKIYDESVRTPELDKIINNGIVEFASNIEARKPGRYTRYKLGKEIPNAISGCIDFMDTETKSKVLSEILGKQNSFYPYARKILAQTAVELASSDAELVGVLNSFYKVMEKKAFFEIVDKITDGIDNPGVKKVLDKTKKFHVCRYEKAEVKNDSKKRVELLKDIARTPSSAKNLNFMINFSVSDLKEMASIMRFNFLQWYFRDRFKCTARNYSRPDRYKAQLDRYIKNTGLDKITIDTMTDNELTEMLFGVGLKKNDEVTKFVERYKCYKKVEAGISLQKDEVGKTFGRYGYYYW
jgi:hypothetical protein